jgi:hypothetical protein
MGLLVSCELAARKMNLRRRNSYYGTRSSSGRRGLGQGVKAQLVRSGSSANRKLGSRLVNCRLRVGITSGLPVVQPETKY